MLGRAGLPAFLGGATRWLRRPPSILGAGRRSLAHALGAAALSLAACAGTGGPARQAEAERALVVSATARQTIRGWGMSLAWEANKLYGSPWMRPLVHDPAERDRYMDLLYGDPAHGLGLNIARYNIGAGTDPDPARCTGPGGTGLADYAKVESYLMGPGEGYDWSRDAGQRRMLREAKRRGADVFEAFSNSAPWWMTASGCVSGAEKAGENNLRADAVPAFAAYLAMVAAHFRAEGIRFESVSPVNEPDAPWWVKGNRQEGGFATLAMQEAVIKAVAQALAGSGAIVSGTEPNSLDKMAGWLERMAPDALAALGRINVHQYQPSDPRALRKRAMALGKPVWASEVGCCFEKQAPIEGALFMAATIRRALVELGAEAWCFWQPDWGVIGFNGGRPQPLKQFYAIAQHTRFIRPGFRVLESGSEGLAAASPDGRRIVVVLANEEARPKAVRVDLSVLGRAGRDALVYRTTEALDAGLSPGGARVGADGMLRDQAPGKSVTTYVIDGPPTAFETGPTHRH